MYVLLEVTLKVLYGFVGLCAVAPCLFCRNVPCNSVIYCNAYIMFICCFLLGAVEKRQKSSIALLPLSNISKPGSY